MCWVAIKLSHFDFFYFAVSTIELCFSDFLVCTDFYIVCFSRFQLFDGSLHCLVFADGDVLFAFFELFVLGVCNLIAGRFLIPFPAYSITISLFPLFFVLILSSDFLCSWLICFRSPICIFTI